MTPSKLCHTQRHPLKDSRFAEDAGNDHHACQKEDDVEVDSLESLLLGDEVQKDCDYGPKERRERSVDALTGDENVGSNEDDAAEEQWVHGVVLGHMTLKNA